MAFNIRPAHINDLDVISEYNVLMAQETEDLTLSPDVVRQGVNAILRDPAKGIYYVIQSADKVVAQLMVTYEWSDWRNKNLWWIQSVYVHPEARKQGLFSKLYKHAQEEALKAGAGGLRLYVDSNNISAQAVYAKLGMKSHYLMFEEEFADKH